MGTDKPESSSVWIIGYGNLQRRDDGIGHYVVDRISREIGNEAKITLRSMHQLDPMLAEEVQGAEVVIFVDATVEPHEHDLIWTRVQPQRPLSPIGMHHLNLSMLAALLESLYERSPRMWVVSVKANDLGHGEGLSAEAQEKGERAIAEIIQFCCGEVIDNRHGFINDGACLSGQEESKT
ncbi:MAG: hydrogenase maturation protease [Deltaproteobacteria bacterium]|nr:hydrogenase maturation protease [Deltaproteobacteria bacterium]MBW2064802.1 hydrogenase maturation protease [Deltaproteobacteria bacterium]